MNVAEKPVVSLERCPSYDPPIVRDAVRAAVELLGGIRRFVRTGQRVLLKPNLLVPRPPEDAITTHPALVAAMIALVQSVGATPVVGDSPGLVTQGIENVWRETGMAAVCEEAGVELLSFEAAGAEAVQVAGRTLHLSKAVTEADVVISLPKLKTHTMTVLTCAVKNLYGTLPGLGKADWHAKLPKPSTFQLLLVDVLEAARPALTVVDAVIGMEGDGPSAGSPKALGFLAASADPVALDTVCAHVVGLPADRIRYLAAAHERGLGVADMERIEIAGESPARLRPDEFRPARTTALQFVPEFLLDLVKPLVWVRPGFGAGCKQCGECVRKCPAGALTRGETAPVLDEDRCIECFCCHEICPESAVELRLSWVVRLFTKT